MNMLRANAGVAFGQVVYPPGGAFGPRTQQDWQLFIVLEGTARVTVNDAPLEVRAGQMLLLHPGSREHFAFSATQATRHTWCALHPDRVDTDLHSSLEGAARGVISSGARVNELVQFGLGLPEVAGLEDDALLHALAVATLRAYLLEVAQLGAARTEPPAVTRARTFIDAHLETKLTLEGLALEAGSSAQHLTRLFKQHLFVTPMRFVWQRRVARGVQLLLETGLSVAAVSERVGFESPFHFSKLVRQTHGASPRALREAQWKERQPKSP
jgi:AraC-like DNA-binding protein